jgi:hypothetical protein
MGVYATSMRSVAVGVAFVTLFVATPARASAIGTTVQQLAAALDAPALISVMVVAAPLESDVPPVPAHADELAVRVAQLVAGKMQGGRATPKPLLLEQARAAASHATLLVYVRVQIVKSELHLTADLYPVIHNAWDRVRLPPPAPTGHGYAAAPVDAEIRAFFPPLPLELTTVHKASHGETDVLAVACGDLDGSGPELALVGRERITLGRVRAGKLDVARTIAWSTLGKRSPVPLRDPLGGAEIATGALLAGTSDRGGVLVDDKLAAHHLAGIPIGAGMCAPISGARLQFEGLTPCDALALHPPSFDAASAFALVSRTGGEAQAVATHEGGKLRVRVNGQEKAAFDGAGAQVVVLDANLDGVPEIAFSSAEADDMITIATLEEHGPRIVSRIPAPAGVKALGACPPLDAGGAAIVAAVGSEVWIVR